MSRKENTRRAGYFGEQQHDGRSNVVVSFHIGDTTKNNDKCPKRNMQRRVGRSVVVRRV